MRIFVARRGGASFTAPPDALGKRGGQVSLFVLWTFRGPSAGSR